MSTRLTVFQTIEEIAADQNKKLAPPERRSRLLESGLDSLCFAILVARLGRQARNRPFTASDEAYFPVTLGDFVKSYEHAKAA